MSPQVDRFELTKEEKGVLVLLSEGYTTEQVADEMETSRASITNMKRLIFFKLGADNQTHAVAIALREKRIK